MSEGSLVALSMAKRSRGVADDGAAEAFYRCPCRRNQVVALVKPISSLLTHSFNQAWASVLDLRDSGVEVKYFAMLHDDISPSPWWVDTLIDELERVEADVVSAVVPIKGPDGTTSTAVYTGDIWLPRRLTMAEVMELPETFGRDDVEGPLLLNTGCWVADITKPWAEQVCFDFMNRIRKTPNGHRVAECVPEDWLNSHRLNELGCKLYATRKVVIEHHGNGVARNDQVWGWDTDKVYQRIKGELACA